MVAIAQLVEPQLVELSVAGSSPVSHPIFALRRSWVTEESAKLFFAGFDPLVALHLLDASK